MNEIASREENRDSGSGDLPAARQSKLVDLVKERGQVTIGELVTRFGVSRDTIRRDLTLLETRRLVSRTHGGVVRVNQLVPYTTLGSRMDTQVSAKERIGRAAACLIRDGESLIINAGSTTTYFVAELSQRRELTIVTNNLRVLPALPEQCVRAAYLLGGLYLPSAQAVVNFDGFATMPGIRVNTAVIGPAGISVAGFSIGTIEEARSTRAMMDSSQRTILVADRSKFNLLAFAHVAELRQIEHLVTDTMPDGALRAALEEAEVEILVCEPR